MFLLLLAIAFIVYVNLPFFKALKKEEKFESVIANPIIITKTTVSVKPTVNSKPPVAANPTINSKPPVAIKPTVNSKPRVAVKPTVTVKTYVAAKYTVTSKPPITANSPAPVKPPVFTPFLRKRKLCVYTDESSLLEISPKICRQKISLDEQEKPPEPPTSDALFLLSILDELSSEIGLDDPMEIDFNGVLSTPLECALEEGVDNIPTVLIHEEIPELTSSSDESDSSESGEEDLRKAPKMRTKRRLKPTCLW